MWDFAHKDNLQNTALHGIYREMIPKNAMPSTTLQLDAPRGKILTSSIVTAVTEAGK